MADNLEFQVKTFLKNNFANWNNLIKNKPAFEAQMAQDEEDLYSKDADVRLSDLLKLSLIRKLDNALEVIEGLELIGEEIVVLNTDSGRGKQPSVDLMAYHRENFCLAIIELKISNQAERQAVTELSAYNQGLLNRFKGLSVMEVLWIPVSTEWRVTAVAALEFQMNWNSIMAAPLELKLTQNADQTSVTDLELRLFDPVSKISTAHHQSLFAYECFDAFDYCYTEDIKDHQSFTNYVTALCTKYRVSGFVIYHKPEQNMQFPYGFTLCVYNPFRGNIYDTLAIEAEKEGRLQEFRKYAQSGGVTDGEYSDIDFKTGELKHWEMGPEDLEGTSLRADASWKKDFLSVSDFGSNYEGLNIHFLFKDLKAKIESNAKKTRALGVPSFQGLMKKWKSRDIRSVTLFGLHLDLIINKISIEHRRGLHRKELFHLCNSFKYLKKSFRQLAR